MEGTQKPSPPTPGDGGTTDRDDGTVGGTSALRPSMIDPSLGDLRRSLLPASFPQAGTSPAEQDPTCDRK
jgi:hypothetical protein